MYTGLADLKVVLEKGQLDQVATPEYLSPSISDQGSPNPVYSPSSGFDSDTSGPDSPMYKEETQS